MQSRRTIASTRRKVQWDFYVVSTGLKGTVIEEAKQAGRPPGLITTLREDTVRVWAKTWGELIEDASHRLKFVREHLEYDPTTQEAFKYLRERHAEYLPTPIADESAPEDAG